MNTECGCRVRLQFRHNEVAVLTAFAQAVLELHTALHVARTPDRDYYTGRQTRADWEQSAYNAARAAVRCARMLELREEYR